LTGNSRPGPSSKDHDALEKGNFGLRYYSKHNVVGRKKNSFNNQTAKEENPQGKQDSSEGQSKQLVVRTALKKISADSGEKEKNKNNVGVEGKNIYITP